MIDENYQTDRERIEAEGPPAVLELADDFRDKLDELGWIDMSGRRALLLALAKLAYDKLTIPLVDINDIDRAD